MRYFFSGEVGIALMMLAGCATTQRTASSPQPAVAGERSQSDPGKAWTNVRGADVLASSPEPADGRYDVTIEQIRAYVQGHSALIIDARHPEDYAHGHVEGAVNLPAGPKMDAYRASVLHDVAPNQRIVIYCASANCDSGDMVYDYLLTQGFTNMRVYKPGWRSLKDVKF